MKGSYLQGQVIGHPITSSASRMPPTPRSLLLEDVPNRYIPTPAHQSLVLKKQNKVDSMLKRMNKLGKKADKFAHGIREHVKLGNKISETLKGKLSLGARIKLAFCSERSIQLSSPQGKSIRVHYKVVVPLEKIEMANQSENMEKPSQKYMEIVTVDGFDFWFMGFLSYKKAFKYLDLAISTSRISV